MKKRHHAKLPPVSIRSLISSRGDIAAAKELGVTPNCLKKYIKADAAPYASEVAARYLCTSNENTDKTAIIKVDRDTISAVKRLIEASGGKFSSLD